MRFGFVDSIVECTSGERIVAVKAVSLAEEYLEDHFPTFPVLPGVLMLETMAEAGAWLVREAQEFAVGVILLREAKNVTYRSFVKPGNLLRVEVVCRQLARDVSDFVGTGFCQGIEVVKGRFGLLHCRLSERGNSYTLVERQMSECLRARFALLRRCGAPVADRG